MNKRERISAALNHKQPDRVPIDLGGCGQTGISASTLYQLRKALNLESHPIKIQEVYQMLGVVEKDVLDLVESDVIGLWNQGHMFGGKLIGEKPWTMFDGTPVLMPNDFEYTVDGKGDILAYPQGNRNAQPSVHMPNGGSFFDNILRTTGYDEDDLDPKSDYANDFSVMSDEHARYLERESKRLWEETDYAVFGVLGGGGLGDISWIMAPHIAKPKGIRSMADWMMAHLLYPDYVEEVFTLQTEVMLKNLEIYKQAVGDRVCVVQISGTDFGTQNGPFMSLESFRQFYKPRFKQMNDYVHQNTTWKTFYHTCGSIMPYLDDFHEMGLDCLNPLQLSAKGMDAEQIKSKYGDKFVFWGGGVDTQQTLPFGNPDDVRKEVTARIELLNRGGGYVFASIHNIVANVPPQNIIAMYETVLGHSIV